MRNITAACEPRDEILAGTFNPEIFKASLSRVLEDYVNGRALAGADSIYSDPFAFFRDATYVTDGIRDILGNALRRLVQKDPSGPAMQRLDTAFGGGKTHTLIALTHAARCGTEIADVAAEAIARENLPGKDEIRVVGIIGDTVDTIRETRDSAGHPLPNTLWWLIAEQTLDATARQAITARLEQAAAPGSEEFFRTLFGDQPTVLIIDEVAQYLSRMEAAFPGQGAEQAAAFLMSLATYAEDKTNLSIVLSLASATNAFGDYNRLLKNLEKTHGYSHAEAETVAQQAQKGFSDVVERSAEATTPVQESDLSRIMAKRLFKSVDPQAAEQTADAFVAMYRQAGAELPAGARAPELREQMIEHYPFHPSLIAYLAEDLAQVQAFQGTRGLLRTLARAVRRIWERKQVMPLIQTCHLDLSDSQIRNELLGKTGNTDLRSVLDSDVGKTADSAAAGRTVAGGLDASNPHPDGYPVHEWAWRVVFLHSLVGRAGGLQDEKFGIDITSAIYETAAPAIPPVTVRTALEQIPSEANYLRERDGRLYADTAPTLNNIVRRIENSVTDEEALDRVEQVVGRLIGNAAFDVHANITTPEEIPDNVSKPQLGLLSFRTNEFDPTMFVEKHGDAPRVCQNLVFLLAPTTAHPVGETWPEKRLQEVRRTQTRVMGAARKAIALEKLDAKPDAWGVNRDHLQRSDFRDRVRKTPNELRTVVEQSYRVLAYPGRDGGAVVLRDISSRGGPSAGGSGGLHLEGNLLSLLQDGGELIRQDSVASQEVLHALHKFFFTRRRQVSADKLAENFARLRPWPVLEKPQLLRDILREGAVRGAWCLLQMADVNAHKPDALYHQDNPPPMTVEAAGEQWSICTREHAKQLGWLESIVRDPDIIAGWIRDAAEALVESDPDKLREYVEREHDQVDGEIFQQQLDNLIRGGELAAWPLEAIDGEGVPEPEQVFTGNTVPVMGTRGSQVRVYPYHVARDRGWMAEPDIPERFYAIEEAADIKSILNLLSGTALQQSTTAVNQLQLSGQASGGAPFQLVFGEAPLGKLTDHRGLFAEIATSVRFDGGRGRLVVRLGQTDADCRFAAYLGKIKD